MTHKLTSDPIFVGFNDKIFERFGRLSIIIGVFLAILGLAVAIVPQFVTLGLSEFIGWTMIIAGILSLYLVFLSRGRSMIAYLKPILLLTLGVILLASPIIILAALVLVISFYLLLDAFSGFGLAHDMYPLRGWSWMAFNGVISMILAIGFMMGWPVKSLILVGLFVGISLFFDGVALMSLGFLARKVSKS